MEFYLYINRVATLLFLLLHWWVERLWCTGSNLDEGVEQRKGAKEEGRERERENNRERGGEKWLEQTKSTKKHWLSFNKFAINLDAFYQIHLNVMTLIHIMLCAILFAFLNGPPICYHRTHYPCCFYSSEIGALQ